MRTSVILITVAVSALLGSSACINMGAGKSPETRYFLLEAKSTAIPEGVKQKMLAHTAIGIGPVAVPRYLDRPQILTRINDNELQVDEFNQWAEPLTISIPRIMGENMASLTGSNRIRVFPWKPSEDENIQIFLDIHRFEADVTGKVTLKATWRIATAQDHQGLISRQSIIEQTPTGADVAAKVEAMSLALADLALDMAMDLAEICQSLKASTVLGS